MSNYYKEGGQQGPPPSYQGGYPAPNQPGYPPASQGYPAPNQAGYPAPNQAGYPAPNQAGYPAHSQPGYPAANQGYPPSGQGYPPAGQGYPQGAQGYPPSGQGYPAGAPAPKGGQPGGSIPMFQGDMPSEDVNDDPNMPAPVEATAPPPELPQALPGYANIGFEEVFLPPPPYEEVVREPPSREAISGAVALTFEDAKSALLDFVADNCCYGKGPVDEMTLTDLQSSSAFHYILESFCEGRSSKWENQPYKGEAVIVNGPAPGPWDISVPVPQMFKDAKMKIEVPNTAFVKPCHICYGRGYKRCYRCHGRGKLRCNFCNGSGTNRMGGENRRCTSCNGDGRRRCYTCNGYGQTRCERCKAHGNLRWFIELTIKWKNHDDDYIVERTSLPEKLIKGVSGTNALKETFPRVYPINHFPDQDINTASNNLVTQHASKFPSERILMQQQSVRVVPVTNVSYSHKNTVGSFYVYGLENKVHFPNYPAKCCCGCTIL